MAISIVHSQKVPGSIPSQGFFGGIVQLSCSILQKKYYCMYGTVPGTPAEAQ